MQAYTRDQLRDIFVKRFGLDRGGQKTDRKALFDAFVAGAEAVGGLAEWTPFSKHLPHDGQSIKIKRDDGTVETVKDWNSSRCNNWSGSWISSNSPLAQ